MQTTTTTTLNHGQKSNYLATAEEKSKVISLDLRDEQQRKNKILATVNKVEHAGEALND